MRSHVCPGTCPVSPIIAVFVCQEPPDESCLACGSDDFQHQHGQEGVGTNGNGPLRQQTRDSFLPEISVEDEEPQFGTMPLGSRGFRRLTGAHGRMSLDGEDVRLCWHVYR